MSTDASRMSTGTVRNPSRIGAGSGTPPDLGLSVPHSCNYLARTLSCHMSECLDSSARRTRGADAADGITTVRDRWESLTGAARPPRSRPPRARPNRTSGPGTSTGDASDRRGLAVIGWRPPPTHGSTYTRMLQPVTIGTMEITALASPTASSSMFKSTRGTSALPLASRRRRLWYTSSGRQQGHVRLACSRRVVASQSMVPEGRCATPAVLGIRPRHGYGHACRRGTKT